MCDSCQAMRINGVLCHEQGCPDAWRGKPAPCFECGCDFIPESAPTRYSVCPDCIADAEKRERFTDDAMWEVSMDGGCDEIGSVDELGWYGRIDFDDAEQADSGFAGCILSQDSNGFKNCDWHDSREALDATWADIEAEYEAYYESADEA